MKNAILVISGPTASGKSSIATIIAKKYNGVVINADSMQIYKEIPIITAQPLLDIKSPPHLLYGEISVKEICSVGLYLKLAQISIQKTREQNKLPIVVGGSGLYLKSLIYGIAKIDDINQDIRNEARSVYEKIGDLNFYQMLTKKDPHFANLNISDKQRMIRAYEVLQQTGKSITELKKDNHKLFPLENFIQISLLPERSTLYETINQRFLEMMKKDLLREIKSFNFIDIEENHPAKKAIGIKEITSYLNGYISLEEAINKTQQLSRNYAKRQITWIKHQMPDSIKIQYQDINQILPELLKILDRQFSIR